jgi:uncharacterized repeat protein (TIGR01451 family)
MNIHRFRNLRLSLLAALALLPAAAGAQTVWTGTTGDWFVDTNWTAGVPGSTGDAQINNDGTATIAAGGAVAHSVLVGFAAGDDGHVAATGAGTLDVDADLSVGYGGDGTLAISSGAVVSDYSGEIGYTIDSSAGSHGSATVDGAGSAWHHTYELYVGYGNGTLDITNGGTVTDYYGYIAYFPESPGRSTGTVNVDGAGSNWSHDSTLHVGDSGDGVLNVTNGGAVTNGEGYLGFNFDATGTASIDGTGSSWTNFGFFYIGNNGDGTLDVTNGGALNSFGSFAYVGYAAQSTGIATIDGAGSLWTNGHGLYIGFNGNGMLKLTNGGGLSSAFFANVGFSPGSTGTVEITGAGSSFENTGVLSIGGNVSGPGGTGLLRIADGGAASASAVNIWNTATLDIGSGGAIGTPTLSIDGALHLAGGAASLDGALAMTANAATTLEAAAGNEASFAVTGAATLGGALTVDVDGAAPGTYTIVTADGGLGGSTFASVAVEPADAGITADVSYDANHVYLTLASSGGAALTVAPGSVDFGTVPAGITAGPAMFTLASTGTASVTITSIGAAAAPFVAGGGDCPAPPFDLAPSTSCTLGYSFAPTTVGPQNATIAIASSAGARSIQLAGTGMAGVPTTLVLVGGGDQSATVGTAFAAPLVVEVRDDWSNPVPNIGVTFTPPASGASAVLSSTSVTTGSDGRASVGASANAIAGSYVVTANGGLGAPVDFALTNVDAVADVAVSIAADVDFARAGELVDYTITLHNNGPNAANGAAIESALSPLLDVANATWVCADPGESGCAPSGTGNLSDAGLDLASGDTVRYVVTARVLAGVEDGDVETSAHGTLGGDPNGANDTASVSTPVVLFRDGFDGAADAITDLSHDDARIAFDWPAASGMGIGVVLRAESASRETFRIERLDTRGATRARLVAIDGGIERASAWVTVAAGAPLELAFADDAETGTTAAILAGAGLELRASVAGTSISRIHAVRPLRVETRDH